ncbi:S8 family serine peptidase [Paraburkholderia sp. FT54]|uniref:S8 family serine peptidase n=1 Tax=Paraburkholderia sp. FT54 TaxID=3074437 RepID=UPI002877E90F|nr:S8 family serine peptidase [Paraburkholderia sp. FT54]WNC88545.1 S8 family serine peptidase [Paraburkholderia sp. FT54]
MKKTYHNRIRDKANMKKTARRQKPEYSRKANNGGRFLSWKKEAHRGLAAAASVSLLFTLAACGGSGSSDASPAATSHESSTPTLESTAALAAKSTTVPLALSLKMGGSSLPSDTTVDRFIVKYKSTTAERTSTTAVQSRLDRLAGVFPSKARHLRRMGVGSDVITTERKLNADDARKFMRAIASDPDVEYVEPDVPISVNSTPNDPFYNLQWGVLSNLDPGQSNVGIRAAKAWDNATGAGITIGLVDNGVASHSDLNANIIPQGFDFTYLGPPGGSNPGVAGGCGYVTYHGTHVAGIMAAVTNNGIGISGIAPSAKVVSARVLNGCGTGVLSSASDAVMWASGGSVPGIPDNTRPVSVINLSISAPGQCSKSIQASVDYATSHGVVVIAAAGNDNKDASNSQPANCHGVIAVGNTQENGARANDSNYGATVDIAAPGTNIYSTYNDGTRGLGAESYAYLSGTSMATPMVSGVVALVKSVAPMSLSSAEMRTLITQNAQPFPKQPDQPLGSGIIDAAAAVAAAKAGKIPAAADFSCSQGEAGMTVTCTDLSTARGATSIRSWAWNFGASNQADLVTKQSTNPNYNYEYPGTYNITLTTTDSTGAISWLTRPFLVAPPVATAISPETHVMVPAQANVRKYFSLDVPVGTTFLRVAMATLSSLATGTMYVTAGSPTTVGAACVRSYSASTGGSASCIMPNPTAGTYYIILSPNANLNGADLFATFNP